EALIHCRVGGNGPPLLLLHGYPQTHVMWHPVAEDLSKTHTVIAPDIRGYGASRAKTPDYTFRAMASDLIALMDHLGHATFDVVSHDRGARIAHRLTLDHPDRVGKLCLMDILPTLDVWATMDDVLARKYWHWSYLAQPTDLPERTLRANPQAYLDAAFLGLGGADIFHPDALAAYADAARDPAVTDAWVADYRAAANEDLDHDRADLGRSLPHETLILWGSKGVVAHHVDPVETWQEWFPKAHGHPIEAGHFLVEERPTEVLSALDTFL
ncbi:MAG: alpha/beta hydrolase, partial [Pseudomonadota bacterium]